MNKYKAVRRHLLAKEGSKRLFSFLRLPELKFLKTCGFIASMLF